MMRVRAHARLVAALWLTCQVAAFAAAPFALCHDHGVMTQTGDGHECGPQHRHAPESESSSASHEHHHHPTEAATTTSDEAAVSCRCTVSDAALAVLTLDTGVLPGEFVLDTRLTAARVVVPDYAIPTRIQPIDTPPPRA